jgi:hypothetical protein
MVNCFLTSNFTERLCNVGSAYFYRSNGIEIAGCLITNPELYLPLHKVNSKSVEKYLFCVSVYNIYTVKHGENDKIIDTFSSNLKKRSRFENLEYLRTRLKYIL